MVCAATAIGFALMGVFAAVLTGFLRSRPKLVEGLNLGAGATFVASSVSIVALGQK